jgi:hypothetical protein
MTSDPRHDSGQAGSLPHHEHDNGQAGSPPHHEHDNGQAGSPPHRSQRAGSLSLQSQPAGSLSHIDRRVREAFEPDALSVARVTAGSVSAAPAHDRGRRQALRLAWVGGTVLAAALGTAVYWRAASGPRAEPVPADLITGSFAGDVLVLSEPDGSVSLSGPGTREDRPPEGFGIVLVEGDLK